METTTAEADDETSELRLYLLIWAKKSSRVLWRITLHPTFHQKNSKVQTELEKGAVLWCGKAKAKCVVQTNERLGDFVCKLFFNFWKPYMRLIFFYSA